MHAILCFGASITWGRGEQPAGGWPGRLKDWFEAQDPYNAVYNLGVCGHTANDVLKRFDAEAKARIVHKRPGDAFLILLSVGTNDACLPGDERKPNNTPEQFDKDVRSLLEKAKAYDAKLGWIGLLAVDETKARPYEDTSFSNERVKLFNGIAQKACAERGVPFLDVFDLLSKEELADGLHPNERGHEKLWVKVKGWIEDERLLR